MGGQQGDSATNCIFRLGSLLAWGCANYAAGDNRASSVIMLVANAVVEQGRLGEAETLYREALEARIANRPPGHRQIAETRNALAYCLVAQNRRADAEPLLVAVAQQTQTSDANGPTLVEAMKRLVTFHSEWDIAEPSKGRGTQAAEWRANLEAIPVSTQPVPQPAAATQATPNAEDRGRQ